MVAMLDKRADGCSGFRKKMKRRSRRIRGSEGGFLMYPVSIDQVVLLASDCKYQAVQTGRDKGLEVQRPAGHTGGGSFT